ncbi:MAG: family 16 glycosylhydrolase [Chitinispirillaceae bacterium]
MKTVLLCLCLSVAAPLLAQERYRLVWSDEFDYTGLPDQSRWGYDVGGHGWGNQELQYYTESREKNARVENGNLIITARRESYEGSDYTSARLVTRNKGDWKYCRVEIKAKLPQGNGTWPAIWMLPTDNVYGGWPASGELDIMEAVGFDTNRIHSTIHSEAYNHKNGTQRGGSVDIGDAYGQFNIYAMEWSEQRVDFFVNEMEVFSFGKEPDATSAQWPFDQPFHLLLNIAIGGAWGGIEGIDNSVFPQQMVVDYVRVYEKLQSEDCSLDIQVVGSGEVVADPDLNLYTPGETVSLAAQPVTGWEFRSWAGDVSGSENPVEIAMNRDRTVTAVFVREGELILNGGFDSALTGWSPLAAFEGAAAQGTVENGEFRASITSPGEHDWTVQFTQSGIPLEKGASYVLAFDAYADEPRTIAAGVNQNQDPWVPYHKNTFSIGTEKETCSYVFQMEHDTDSAARIEFDLGLFTGNLYIDNVSLMKEEPFSSVNNCRSQVPRNFEANTVPETRLYDLRGRMIQHLENDRKPMATMPLIRVEGADAVSEVKFK